MLTIMLLSLAISAQDPPGPHVRTAEPRILALIEAGVAQSATFRRLMTTLDESQMIVYIERKSNRQGLGGYLAHNIVAQGDYRYLRIAVETQGSRRRLVSLLAHELQHAVEVAQATDARDQAGVERLFAQRAVKFGCGSTTCYETQAARDVEYIVNEEFSAKSPPAASTSGPIEAGRGRSSNLN
jgi:hypothetical protein